MKVSEKWDLNVKIAEEVQPEIIGTEKLNYTFFINFIQKRGQIANSSCSKISAKEQESTLSMYVILNFFLTNSHKFDII